MTEKAVVKYDITEAAIAEMESQFMGLSITDIENKEQFQIVHDARMVVKIHRVAVEKKRKELKADALAWGKKVDSEAKRIFGMLEPIESHLMAEENKVLEEQKRIEAENAEKERQIIQNRIDILFEYGVVMPFQEVAVMADDIFNVTVINAKLAYAEERKRLTDEAAARKAEDERLSAERAELEKQRKEQEEKAAARKAELDAIQEKIAADKAALEDEKRGIEEAKRKEKDLKDRIAFEAKAKEEARIKAEQDAIEAAEIAKMEAELKAEAERLEAARQKALRPDKEKLTEWVSFLMDISPPELENEEAVEIVDGIMDGIGQVLATYQTDIDNL